MVNPKSSVFLFIGKEEYLKEKALEELRLRLLNGSSKELDYKIFYGASAAAKEILDFLTTFPFLAARRLVVIKDFERLSHQDKERLISHIISKPSKSAYLVLDSSDGSILKTHRAVGRYVDISRFDRLTDSEVSSWIKRFLSSRGKGIEEDAVEVLKELHSENLVYLSQELEKLITFIGAGKVIKLSDVEVLVGKGLVTSAFDLTWAIGEKKVDKAISLVYALTLSGKKPHEIIGILCWHLRRISKALAVKSKGGSNYSIISALKINSRFANEFLKQVNSFDIDRVRSKMNILLEADLDIKRTRYDPNITLEFAVIKLCLG